MLRRIRIENLAVVESVDVEFVDGLNVLTGETGSGKSIVAEAIDLLLGGRASSDLVRTGKAQATLEGVFERGGSSTRVRREIASSGRSRSFVDGSLVTAGELRERTRGLIDMHGQHEQQRLLDIESHLPTLDAFGELAAKRAVVEERWGSVRQLRDAHQRASMDARERTARLEWLSFQLAELETAQPRELEDEELLVSKQRLQHAERVQRLCRESYDVLLERDGSISELLGGVWKRLDELAGLDPDFAAMATARGVVADYLDELGRALRATGESLDDAEDQLERVEDRLVVLERLKRQHGPTMADVQVRWQELLAERDGLQATDAPEALREQVKAAEAEYLREARQLSRLRRATAKRLAEALQPALVRLGMADTRFDVRFESESGPDAWGAGGVDSAQFYVSTNLGEEPRPLARIASGGELSRVMLALHLVSLGRSSEGGLDGRGLVFDEVDAGIGGRVAEAVGESLRELSARVQVICITHLAAIAACADAHLAIDKRTVAGRTVTQVRRVDGDERVGELARMMAGSRISDVVRDSARELLRSVEAGTGESQSDGKRRKRKS